VVVVALLLLAALAWWSTTGGRIEGGSYRVSMQSLALDHEYYVGYRIPVTGGDVKIGSVRLAHAPEGVTTSFVVAKGPCPIGTSNIIFEGCDPIAARGAGIASGTEGMIIGGFTLDHNGTYELGPLVVTYHSGLHRRTVIIDPAGCLTTEPTSVGCKQTFPQPNWPNH